jgi:hypothetical protein
MRSLASLILSFGLGLATAGASLAQTPVPVQATITPAPSCEKPGDPPASGGLEIAKDAAERRRSNWSKSMKGYIDCLKRFVEEQQAAAAPHIKAANAAVDEINKAVKIHNDQIEAAKPQ